MTRHRRTLQRLDPGAVGGSLYRFDCIRRTIVTISRFAEGNNPVTLPNGVELVDLPSVPGSGTRQRTTEVPETDGRAGGGSSRGSVSWRWQPAPTRSPMPPLRTLPHGINFEVCLTSAAR